MNYEHPDAVLRARIRGLDPVCRYCVHFLPEAWHWGGGGWCAHLAHPPDYPQGDREDLNTCEKFLDKPT